MRRLAVLGAAVATALFATVLARSTLQTPAVRPVDEAVLREYAGVYQPSKPGSPNGFGDSAQRSSTGRAGPISRHGGLEQAILDRSRCSWARMCPGIVVRPSDFGGLSSKPAFLSGSGGLLSTTDDYFRFAQMLLSGGEADGKRFLKASTVELLRTNVLDEGVQVDIGGPGIGFGLDFAIVMDPAVANTPEGRNSFYWGSAYGTWF
jgi:CubicO group peptidase (beta-lactamase class C family)